MSIEAEPLEIGTYERRLTRWDNVLREVCRVRGKIWSTIDESVYRWEKGNITSSEFQDILRVHKITLEAGLRHKEQIDQVIDFYATNFEAHPEALARIRDFQARLQAAQREDSSLIAQIAQARMLARLHTD